MKTDRKYYEKQIKRLLKRASVRELDLLCIFLRRLVGAA